MKYEVHGVTLRSSANRTYCPQASINLKPIITQFDAWVGCMRAEAVLQTPMDPLFLRHKLAFVRELQPHG
jgi:hypothetical protein